MESQSLFLQRIRELNFLTKDVNLIFCLYPFSFALKELIKENLEESNFQRVFTSSVEESKRFLISTDKEFIIFISDLKVFGEQALIGQLFLKGQGLKA